MCDLYSVKSTKREGGENKCPTPGRKIQHAEQYSSISYTNLRISLLYFTLLNYWLFEVKVAQTWVCVSVNLPVLYLFGVVLHCGPPLLHLHHQALKQPLLILQGLPDLHHPKHMRDHNILQKAWADYETTWPPGAIFVTVLCLCSHFVSLNGTPVSLCDSDVSLWLSLVLLWCVCCDFFYPFVLALCLFKVL